MFNRNNIIFEDGVKPGGISNLGLLKDLINKAEQIICRIEMENNGYGSGFFL